MVKSIARSGLGSRHVTRYFQGEPHLPLLALCDVTSLIIKCQHDAQKSWDSPTTFMWENG